MAALAIMSDIGFHPGQVLHLPEGLFRIEAKSFNSKGVKVRLASVADGAILSKVSGELHPYSPCEQKLAHFIRFAFNQDFDKYVKDSIRAHGLPVDEEMDWSKWFEANTGTYKSIGGDQLRDEAIHNLLIWALVEKDVLGKYDPTKVTDETSKALPVERQLTNYLIARFRYRFDYIKKYMVENGTDPNELSGDSPDGETPGIFDRKEGDFDSPQELAQKVQEDVQFNKFRTEFIQWLQSDKSGLQKRTVGPVKVLFDLILVADNPKPANIVHQFVALTGAAESSMKGYIKQLGKALVSFSEQAPKGLVNLPLISQIRALAPKSSSKKESTVSLKEKLAALKAKYAPVAPAPSEPKIDKWAKLRHIAENEPEEMGGALGELAVAFAELAEAADALAENLGVDPEAAPAEEGEVAPEMAVAAKKAKYAKFRQIAMDSPGSLVDALQEVYGTLDTVAEGIENLAQNLGIDLGVAPEADLEMGGDMDAPADLGMAPDLGAEPGLEEAPPVGPMDAPAAPDDMMAASAKIDAEEWEYLYQERVGIKEDSGIAKAEAEAQAKAEITKTYGPKPITAARRAMLAKQYSK
jgi:hypothetical protein